MQKKNKMRIWVLLFSLFVFAENVISQDSSKTTFTYREFIDIVVKHHPLARTADIQLSKGDAGLLYAKGAFDPQLYGDVNQKYFDGTQYYSKINSGLKVPTWFGLEFTGGYEQNQGAYLNPENSNPNSGLVYAGVSMSLGQGLIIDKRRAELKKAHLVKQNAVTEKQIALNNLIYEAGDAYWNWFKAYHSLLVFENAQSLARDRFRAVRQEALLGDRPFVDTLEAGIQVQNRMLGVQQLKLEFKNQSALIGLYLWENGVIPLELKENVIPESQNFDLEDNLQLEKLQDSLLNTHPILNQQQNKISQLEVQQKWKKEQLKPIVNLKYNPIIEPVGNQIIPNYSINNYTWGVGIKMPILLRKERGDLKLTNLQIQESNLQLANKREILQYKQDLSFNNWRTSIEQINLYAKTTEDYLNLLKAERQLFREGESSLFMVNSREVGYIQTELKLIELLVKNRKAKLTAEFAYGQLFTLDN